MENKNESPVILSVKDLVVHFSTDHGYVQAVRGISFDLHKGETLCIVGESGSGKSVTSKTIMGILAANGRIKGGSIMYEGEDLTKVSEDEFHRIRGHKIGMIFQDPLSSLNPIVRIGKQITEAMLINNSRIKKLYQDKIAKELVAYRNAQTEKKSAIINAKDNINFLKVDRKKVADSYVLHHQIVASKIYEEEKKMLAVINEKSGVIADKNAPFETELEALYEAEKEAKKENRDFEYEARIAELQNLIATNNQELKEEIAVLKKDFAAIKRELKKDKGAERKANRAEVRRIHKEYDQKIKEAKAAYKVIKKESNEKYNPQIKETKAAYKARCVVAKKEVAEYRLELKDKLNQKLADNTAKYEEKLKEIEAQYIKELGEVDVNNEEAKKNVEEAHEMRLKLAKETLAKNQAKAKEKYIKATKITKKEAKERALKIMAEVGIPAPEKRYRQYPFEFSGGMRQRIVIAIALTADPDILICDEPTTALDVTIQAQILELINRLKESRNLSCIFITHDLGVVANMADRVAVMYAGKIVEYGLADEIFYDPKHPYTWALLSSIPDVDSKERLDAIPGTPPNMIYPPKGDAFALRSKYALKIDFEKEPPYFKISDTHYAATWLLDPRAPKVEMPKIVKTRIENSLKAAKAKKGDNK